MVKKADPRLRDPTGASSRNLGPIYFLPVAVPTVR